MPDRRAETALCNMCAYELLKSISRTYVYDETAYLVQTTYWRMYVSSLTLPQVHQHSSRTEVRCSTQNEAKETDNPVISAMGRTQRAHERKQTEAYTSYITETPRN
jgi:hypothetical protein